MIYIDLNNLNNHSNITGIQSKILHLDYIQSK